MADSDSNIVSIVGILAIVILVGLAVYFVMRESDEAEFELDVGSSIDAPAHVAERTAAPPAPNVRFTADRT